MDKGKVKHFEFQATDTEINRVLEEGIGCCANVEVGEVVSCLMTMFEHIQESEMIKRLKQVVDQKNHSDIDQCLICIFVSEIATITANFKGREEKGAEA